MYLTQGLHRSVQHTPRRDAVICGSRSHSHAELADRVARLAGALRDRGVQAGDRVAIAALNSERYHEYLLAVPWANAVLNPVNIRWSAEEIAYSLRDSETQVLFVDDMFVSLVPRIRERYDHLQMVIHLGDAPTPQGMLD